MLLRNKGKQLLGPSLCMPVMVCALALIMMFAVTKNIDAAVGHLAILQDFTLGSKSPGDAARYDVAASKAKPVQQHRKEKPRRSVHNHTMHNLVRGMQAVLPTLSDDEGSAAAAMRILDRDDEAAYRALFAALDDGRLNEIEKLSEDVENPILMSTVDALALLHPRNPQVTYEACLAWLKENAAHPLAPSIYKKAKGLRTAGAETLPAPPVDAGQKMPMAPSATVDSLEWKKPKRFTAEAAWRAGKYDEVLEQLADVDETDPSNAYTLWVKGLSAYAQQDYALAAHCFTQLTMFDLETANVAAAAYWAARSFDQSLQNEKAALYYEQAALHPYTYYGMLALAHKASADSSILDIWQQPKLTGQHLDALKRDPAGARGLALLQVQQKDLALKELQTLRMKPGLQDALQAISAQADVPVMPVASAERGDGGRFAVPPVMPWRPRGGFMSDPALVMAVAWNESRFNAKALSPSGARGVMQLLPGTAERVQAGGSGTLYNAEANVTLGDLYLHKLATMNGIDGNLVLLIAGYNCGPGKVQQLYQEAQQRSAIGKDPLLFIETLPLKETRDYVQRVLTNYAAYRLRGGQPLQAMAELDRGEWPGYDGVRTAANKPSTRAQ